MAEPIVRYWPLAALLHNSERMPRPCSPTMDINVDKEMRDLELAAIAVVEYHKAQGYYHITIVRDL